MSKLPRSFYVRQDVVQISKELLGKYLFTNINDKKTGGTITETEAYAGPVDRASHAYKNRRTKRTEIMYQIGGTAYVYLCYGIHSLFNIITNIKDIPHAVLIRAIEPKEGVDVMLKRRNKNSITHNLTTGPGTLTQALGITCQHTGIDLLKNTIWVEDRNIKIPQKEIIASPRVGISYAGEDAELPWRFMINS